MKLSTEKKIMDLENRLVVAKGDGEGMGWIGSLGLTDADYLCFKRFILMYVFLPFDILIVYLCVTKWLVPIMDIC